MPRPKINRRRERTNLTLNPTIKAAAEQYAASNGEDLSKLVERVLQAELASRDPHSLEHRVAALEALVAKTKEPLPVEQARLPFRRAG